jgi:prepilin peptidase CpaA
MALLLDITATAGFTGLMAMAAVEDFRRLVIPNAVVLGLCALWPLQLAAAPSLTLANTLGAAGCAAVIFLVGAMLFWRGLIGGGDVKLLAAASLWAGPGMIPALLLTTAVLGGLLTLVLLSVPALRVVCGSAAGTALRSLPVPYGVAIAAAAVIVMVQPKFS